MRVHSYIYVEGSLQPVEVEVLTQKGLPQLQFIGLPDQVIKESAVRIKSAIKSCGFEWPQAKQIIVNLKPSHLKKSSRGLEFAVAAAIIWETGQLNIDEKLLANLHLYGELDLEGNIYLPEDLKVFSPQTSSNQEILFTGKINQKTSFWSQFPFYQLTTLKDLASPTLQNRTEKPWIVVRPTELNHILLTDEQKEFIQLCVLGEHHSLLAGPAGSGKSLAADIIHSLRKFPTLNEEINLFAKSNIKTNSHSNSRNYDNNLSPNNIANYNYNYNSDISLKSNSSSNSSSNDNNNNNKESESQQIELWRPLVKPHHSITVQGLVGGGLQLHEGELSRADGGTLIFDELLEFKPQVVEALREPLETCQLRLARSSGVVTFNSHFLWIATTNLCPCGDFTPGKPVECRYSLLKCRSYGQKLSGPLIDRFDIICYTHKWKGQRKHTVQSILEELKQLPFYQNKESKLEIEKKVEAQNLPFVTRKILDSWMGSMRRKKATLRVAYTFAKLNKRELINEQDVEKAMDYTVRPFLSMQRWD